MPPPPGRGRGRGRRGGRGRGRGRGEGRGVSPSPRRKDDDDPFDFFDDGDDRKRSGSSGLADDEASSPSESPSGNNDNANRKASIDDLQRSYDFARDEDERSRLREELEKLREEEEIQNKIIQSKNRTNALAHASPAKNSRNREETLALMDEALGIKRPDKTSNEDSPKQQTDIQNNVSHDPEDSPKKQTNIQNNVSHDPFAEGNINKTASFASKPRKEMNGGGETKKVVLTWVGRKEDVKNIKKSQKELMKVAKSVVPPTGTFYVICEKFDTYLRGGLYPLFHMSEDSGTINKLLNSDAVDPDILGPENTVDQGLFEEIACITPQQEAEESSSETVMAVFSFKSIEPSPHPKLIKEWKQWSGARAFLQDIVMVGLQCHKIRFFVKVVGNTEEAQGFYYALTTEVGIREPSDEGLFVDTLQRFRVERWFGYSTIYKKH